MKTIEHPKIYEDEPKPLVYISGGHTNVPRSEEERWIRVTKCKYRCFSFAYTCPGAFYYNRRMHKSLDISMDNNVRIMMDSGAYSFHKFLDRATGSLANSKRLGPEAIKRLKEETIELYIEYCKSRQAGYWDFYFNFDYRIHAPTVYSIQRRLEKAGLRPVPVFHGDDGLDWFRRYCEDGHKLIGLGGKTTAIRSAWRNLRKYYERVFNIAEKHGVKLHGFGVNSLSLMFEFPWYSVDATTWIKTAAYGRISFVNPVTHTVDQIHVSTRQTKHCSSYATMDKSSQKMVREQVEAEGFDFEKLRISLYERGMYNARIFSTKIQHLKELIYGRRARWESLIDVD